VVDEEESKEASRAAARAARAAARASRVRVDGELLCVIVLTGAKGCIDVSWLFSGLWSGQFAILDYDSSLSPAALVVRSLRPLTPHSRATRSRRPLAQAVYMTQVT